MDIITSESHYPTNGSDQPFVVALVDNPADSETVVVVMFAEQGFTAVFSLDSLINDEIIDIKARSGKYENLREILWT